MEEDYEVTDKTIHKMNLGEGSVTACGKSFLMDDTTGKWITKHSLNWNDVTCDECLKLKR